MRAAAVILVAVAVSTPDLPARAAAQQPASSTLIARVLDRSTGRQVVNALVVLDSSGPTALTDSTGMVRIDGVGLGAHALTVSSLGYATQRLQLDFTAGISIRTDVQLAPRPLLLEPLHVAAAPRQRFLDLVGFYERERQGGGTFISGEALATLAARTNLLAEAMRMARGFRLVPARGTGWAILSSRIAERPCFPSVYVDGIRFAYGPNPDSPPMPRLLSSDIINFNDVMPLAAVGAIEAYSDPAGAPLEYDRNPCGVILIWTQHGAPAPEK